MSESNIGAELFARDTQKMLQEINDIVSNDWGFSVTDDMAILGTQRLKKFTQKQAQEMSKAIGDIFMISHAISCSTCGAKYKLTDLVATDKDLK